MLAPPSPSPFVHTCVIGGGNPSAISDDPAAIIHFLDILRSLFNSLAHHHSHRLPPPIPFPNSLRPRLLPPLITSPRFPGWFSLKIACEEPIDRADRHSPG